MKQVIIVDDEQAAIVKLSRLLSTMEDVSVLATFSDAKSSLEFIGSHHADIAFLDIDMPFTSGIELAEQMKRAQKNLKVIFVTAYSEYALEAFRVNALDYLLKPVEKERLKSALERITQPQPTDTLPQAKPIEVKCFGKFRVTINAERIKFRTAKAEELFAYFIHHSGQPIHRNDIADLFWPDYEGDKATTLFHTTLNYLKNAFAVKGVPLNILHERGTYRLLIQAIHCDLFVFSDYLSKINEVCDNNIAECQKAVSVYGDDYLIKNEYDWALGRRMKLNEDYLHLILLITDYYMAKGNCREAEELLERALIAAPLHKKLNLQLLKVFLKSKNITSFMNYYGLYEIGLKSEYGLEVDSEFNHLYQLMVIH